MKRYVIVSVLCFTILMVCLFMGLRKSNEINSNIPSFKYDSNHNLDKKLVGNYGDKIVYYIGIDNLYLDDTRIEDYFNSAGVEELKKSFNKYIYLEDDTAAFYCDDDSKCDKSIRVIYCSNNIVLIGEKKEEFSVKLCKEVE